MKENDQRGLYLTEKIKNVAYNAKYNIMKFFEGYSKDEILEINDEIFILGRKFTVNQNNIEQVKEIIYQIFLNTPWLTYRSGFPQLPNQVVGSYVSDTGWGCMVRVGQMLFAQVIKTHRNITDKIDVLNIISLFSDYDKTQPFSIHKIARLARIQYGLKPGDWYNPSQISFILSELHKQHLASQMKLKFIVFHSGNLFFDSLIQGMLQQSPRCSCNQKRSQLVCQICNKEKYSISIIILSRIGLDSPQKKYLTVLQKIMESPFCQGVIGGKPKKALYFIGKQKEQFIYLDPHYVQQAEKNIKYKNQTYFCESFRKCKDTAIDSSIGICFYLRSIKELNQFYKQINKFKTENYQDFFIFVSDKTPNYIKQNPLKSVEINVMKDNNFQMI